MHRIVVSIVAAAFAAIVPMGSLSSAPNDEAALEQKFDSFIRPDEMRGWLKLLSSEPNNVGSPHDKTNADWILAQFRNDGWDAHIETFRIVYPTPVSETLELLGPKPFKATLQEPPIPGDSSATATGPALPAYLVYQGDGDVRAGLVYVNYGSQDDYKTLDRLGVSVKGRIVIARYGAIFRGVKARLAQDHGAIGCIIYSDPADDGYAVEKTYPDGPARPLRGIQRGSVADMTMPLAAVTPGGNNPVKIKIPALPLSYADAQVLLAAIDGPVAPKVWRGSLPITYHVGPGPAVVHLAVKSDWSVKTIYDVIAVMKGASLPDQWVIRGNHHDGWVFGASDPLSGQIALLAEAKAIGALARQGWRPKRTIVYTSWDAEEPMLVGSAEWAMRHAQELKQKAVLYINSDTNQRGFLEAGGSGDFTHFVNGIAADVIDPETKVSVGQRLRAKLRVDALEPAAEPEAKTKAKVAADTGKDFPIDALGSGSDYAAFLEHLGVPALDFGYGGESSAGGVYHSRYDTFEDHSRFVDPGFVYDALLARTVGRAVLRAAGSDLPVQRPGDFADAVSTYLAETRKLADDKRQEADIQQKLIADRVFQLAADPTKPNGLPAAPGRAPHIEFAPLEDAVDRLKGAAAAYDDVLAKNGATLPANRLRRLQTLMLDIDQLLAPDIGLPGRPWYKNLVYAPGRYSGYGAKTLPGVREAIEEGRWADANRYAKLTADALNAYSARLELAAAVLNGK